MVRWFGCIRNRGLQVHCPEFARHQVGGFQRAYKQVYKSSDVPFLIQKNSNKISSLLKHKIIDLYNN